MPSLYTHSCIYCFIFLCFCVKRERERERDSSESIIISHLRSIRPTGTTLSTNQANTAGPLCCICNLIHPDCQSPIAEKAAAAFNHLKTLPSANIAGSIHISNAHISQKVLGICWFSCWSSRPPPLGRRAVGNPITWDLNSTDPSIPHSPSLHPSKNCPCQHWRSIYTKLTVVIAMNYNSCKRPSFVFTQLSALYLLFRSHLFSTPDGQKYVIIRMQITTSVRLPFFISSGHDAQRKRDGEADMYKCWRDSRDTGGLEKHAQAPACSPLFLMCLF